MTILLGRAGTRHGIGLDLGRLTHLLQTAPIQRSGSRCRKGLVGRCKSKCPDNCRMLLLPLSQSGVHIVYTLAQCHVLLGVEAQCRWAGSMATLQGNKLNKANLFSCKRCREKGTEIVIDVLCMFMFIIEGSRATLQHLELGI